MQKKSEQKKFRTKEQTISINSMTFFCLNSASVVHTGNEIIDVFLGDYVPDL